MLVTFVTSLDGKSEAIAQRTQTRGVTGDGGNTRWHTSEKYIDKTFSTQLGTLFQSVLSCPMLFVRVLGAR